jgi:hypothetical protein
MSRIGALCVSQPTEMRSTPVAAIAGAYIVERHVVEQHGVDAGAERLFELRQRVDLDLDLDQVADMAAHAADRLGDAAGDGDVIVLDQRGVVEAEAMVGSAPCPDRVFLQRPHERRRLARADDARLGVRNRRHERCGRAGHSAEPADEIERDALGGQHAARRTLDRRHRSARRDARPVGDNRAEADRRVHQAKGERRHIEAGDDAVLPRSHHGRGKSIHRRDRVGCDVAGAA